MPGILILLLNDAMDPLEHRNDPPRVGHYFKVTRIFAHRAMFKLKCACKLAKPFVTSALCRLYVKGDLMVVRKSTTE